MDYKNAADLVLWQYCREDDMRAYNELFERYYHRLLRLTDAVRDPNNTFIAKGDKYYIPFFNKLF